MKKYLFIVLLFGVGFGQQQLPKIPKGFVLELKDEYDFKDIVEQDGLYYKKFSNDKVSGKIYKNIDGNKVYLGQMYEGKIEGEWYNWYDNGRKKEQMHYVNGKREGRQLGWYESGKKRADVYIENGETRDIQFWRENGEKQQLSKIKDNKRIDKTWYTNGSLSTIINSLIINDTLRVRHGKVLEYYENENIKYEGSFDKGIGNVDCYLESGFKHRVDSWYKIKEFKSSSFFKNGKVKSVRYFSGVHFDYAIPIGKHTTYDKDGVIIEESTWNDGLLMEKLVLDKASGNLIKPIETKDKAKRILCYDKDMFKVYYKQYTIGSKKGIEFELENSYNISFQSVWFMVTATKLNSNEDYSKRISFTEVDRKSSAKEFYELYGDTILKDVSLELTRQRRK